MTHSPRPSFVYGFLLALACVGLFAAAPVLAQEVDVKSFAQAAGFSTEPTITVIVARLIRTVISLVGIVAVVLLVYGGFLWMTSGGDTTRVGRAKKLIYQAIVGLIIVLSSFVIVSFIISRLVEVTGGGSSAGDGGGGGKYPDDSKTSQFYLSDHNMDQCAQGLRNLQIQLVFSRAVNPATTTEAVTVRQVGGEPVAGAVVTDGSLVTFTPDAACPEPNTPSKCFAADADYELLLDASVVKSASGASLNCLVGKPCEKIAFHTGSGVDTTAPTISMTTPAGGDSIEIGTIKQLQAKTQDDTGVSSVNFYVLDPDPIFTAGLDLSTQGELTGENAANYYWTDDQIEWDTAGYVTNKSYPVWASGADCAGNKATAAKVFPVVRAAACFNAVQDEGETGVDCGGDIASPSYCGKCDEQSCEDNNECASGVCEDGACVSKPRIDQVSPGDGALGNLVTISGKGFGAQQGTIAFLGGAIVQTNPYACNGNIKWSNTQIIVQVPESAVDGPIQIEATDGKQDATNDDYGPISPDFDVNAVKRPGLCEVAPDQAEQGAQVQVSGLGFGQVKGSSTLYFRNYIAPSLVLSAPETLYTAVVPNMPLGQATMQLFMGDYACVDATGAPTGQVCVEDRDCGQGNTCAKTRCTQSLAYCQGDGACGEDGGKCASVRVGSNKLAFTAKDSAPPEAEPNISYVESGWKACSGGANNGQMCAQDVDCGDGICQAAPNWGPIGQYVTVYGTNFGSAVGTVRFTGGLGESALGDTNFPPQCGQSFWTDTAVIVKVPGAFDTGGNVEPGNYAVSLTVQATNRQSNSVEFAVVPGTLGPALVRMDPVAGPVGTEVEFCGDHLGAEKGAVRFYNNVPSAPARIWQTNRIIGVVVPENAATGPVVVATPAGNISNPLTFSVGSCLVDLACPVGTQCCTSGACQIECDGPPPSSHFAYRVSTGEIPENPRVVVECSQNAISPSPWSTWPDSQTICRNAAVSATFTKQMDQPTLVNYVLVERCTDPDNDGCAAWAGVEGVMRTDEVSFTWTPNALFNAGMLYRVTVLGGEDGVRAHEDVGGAFMLENYQWQFLTGGEADICEVGSVLVSPSSFIATQENQQVGYSSKLIALGKQCVLVDPRNKTIAWTSNFAGAPIVSNPAQGQGVDTTTVEARVETRASPAKIAATVTSAANQPFDTGDLIIDFSDPEVGGFFPNCSTACVNARPWVRFKVDMNPDSFENAVTLMECANALCAPDGLVDSGIALDIEYLPEANDQHKARTLLVGFRDGETLKANAWYRIVLNGALVESISGVALKDSGSNVGSEQNLYYPRDFSWKFRTKNSDISCGIDSISVIPKNRLLKVVWQTQAYSATAYGAPDDCDASGQALQDADYTWQAWTAQDAPGNPADGGTNNDVAFLRGNPPGAIQLASSLPPYCTSQCLNKGTTVTSAHALCGDGIVNGQGKKASEECDDRNMQSGDGCSSLCLREGVSTTCGNRVLDGDEMCDDGNLVGGDGCSAKCLNEGSSSVGATCGDNVLDFVWQTGGEDCDDGNAKGGDGCSAQCLFEGSMPITQRYATCGNGRPPEDGEDCDDGNFVSGDGCSALCLSEGASLDYVAPSLCGDQNIGTGENCDDGNNVSGDGCSSKCLKEGSSVAYSIPSFCGDGRQQIGEQCDASAGQTLAVGGFAVAQISARAPREVGIGGGKAYSVVTATAEGVTGETLLGIECACQTDLSCGSPATVGCGIGKCCAPRPNVKLPIIPLGVGPGGEGYCRNTAVSIGFTQKMDQASFAPEGKRQNLGLLLFKVGDRFIAEHPELCPAPYRLVSSGDVPPSGLLARAWHWVKREVRSLLGMEVAAAGTECYAPVSFTTQDLPDNTGQRVRFELDGLLEPNALYFIEIVGDTNPQDGSPEGVLSASGVGSDNARTVYNFQTSNEVCLLDAVQVEDLGKVDKAEYESSSPNLFRQSGETHAFSSHAMTYRDGLGVYEEIQGVRAYEWVWNWGSSVQDDSANDIVKVKADEASQFEATSKNGKEYVIATATITTDTLNAPPTVGKATASQTEVTALVCERPWPALDSKTGFPYVEQTDPDKPSNFGFYYCQDRGASGPDDDLPSLGEGPVDVSSVGVGSCSVSGRACKQNDECGANQSCLMLVQELLFKVQGTPDAIGVRVVPNPTYLSPEAWFKLQKFTGAYTPLVMDGYEGIISGSTAYVAAANEHPANTTLYSNIYIVSFNQSAGADARAIFEQVIENWRFNANTDVVTNVGLCKVAGAYVRNASDGFIPCAWDGECNKTAHAFCDDDKAKLKRDLKRLTDIAGMVSTLETYGSKNRHCAVTKSISCTVREQCPGTEDCVASYPTLQQGTFVPALSVSKWDSWKAEFSSAVGAPLPSDPLNAFWEGCQNVGEGYDPATCFNGLQGKFICPDRSHVYGYQSVGGEAYKLFAQLEYDDAPWNDKIDLFDGDKATVVAEYGSGAAPPRGLVAGFSANARFCSDNIEWGVSSVCGDGVRGEREQCEPGQFLTLQCNQNGGNVICPVINAQGQAGVPVVNANGTMSVACKDNCAYQSPQEAIAARTPFVVFQCGNGVLETGETCDDGELNGTYGHCGAGCSLATAFLCGDGYIAAGEQCDCGSVQNRAGANSVQNQNGTWAMLNVNGLCEVANGQYRRQGACSYDCKLSGLSCGDGEVQVGDEQCDGGVEQYAGKLCLDARTPCVSNSDCAGNRECGPVFPLTVCGSGRICIGGTDSGKECVSDIGCDSRICSAEIYELTRTRVCEVFPDQNACTWNLWSRCQGGTQACGNGKLEGSEQCDDGNTSNSDACRNNCTPNICGDGFLNQGVESCDNGASNIGPNAQGAPCAAPYGSSCNYCNTQCQFKTYSGSFCGDGRINGNEFCDGAQMPYRCLKVDGTERTLGGICPAIAGAPQSVCENGFLCRNLGVCNGGSDNGKPCSIGSNTVSCTNGVCVAPTCATDCTAACPFTFKTTSVLVQSEAEGAQPLQSIELYSYLNTGKDSPDNAVLHLPACLVGSTITANIDNSKVTPPNVDVVFVTDLSGSMGWSPGGADNVLPPNRRIDFVSDATKNAVDKLLNAYAASTKSPKPVLRIGLATFQGNSATKFEPIDGQFFYTDRILLKAEIEAYKTRIKNGTPTAKGIRVGIQMFEQSDAAVKILVLLSDGEPYYSNNGSSCSGTTDKRRGDPGYIAPFTYPKVGSGNYSGTSACVAEVRLGLMQPQNNIIFYSAGVLTEDQASLKGYITHMSSEKCTNANMALKDDCESGTYSFLATSAEGIQQMYQKIIDAILGATTTVTATQRGNVQSAASQTPVGNNVNIKLPATFQCQPSAFTMPIKTTFFGTGQMKFDNVKFTYCPRP